MSTYTYRNLPCTNLTWYVSGQDTDSSRSMFGAGILEWCYDEADAQDRLNRMRNVKGRFHGLKICQYHERP